jgi:hypothetical protein
MIRLQIDKASHFSMATDAASEGQQERRDDVGSIE